MLKQDQRLKIKVFVKTYLSLKGQATSKELATYINELDVGLNDGITSGEMGRLLKAAMDTTHKHFLSNLDFKTSSKGRVYFLKKE